MGEERSRALQEAPKRRLADVAREVSETVLSLRTGELDGLTGTVRERVRERRLRRALDRADAEEAAVAVEELLVVRELARIGPGVKFVLVQSRG